jgi:hypothetical protein
VVYKLPLKNFKLKKSKMKNSLKKTGFIPAIILTVYSFQVTAFAQNTKHATDSPGLNPGQIIGGVAILLLYILWALARKKKTIPQNKDTQKS